MLVEFGGLSADSRYVVVMALHVILALAVGETSRGV